MYKINRPASLDVAEVIDSAEPVADAAAARAVLARLVQRNLRQPRIAQLYTVLSAEALDPAHRAHDYFRRRLESSRMLLARRLFGWHPRPALAAVELLAFLDGLQLNWFRDPGIDFTAQWEAFADRVYGA